MSSLIWNFSYVYNVIYRIVIERVIVGFYVEKISDCWGRCGLLFLLLFLIVFYFFDCLIFYGLLYKFIC